MKKIGEGYYYNVYDIGNGRVLKKQKNKIHILLFILFANKLNIKNTAREYTEVVHSIPSLRSMYTKIFNTGIDKKILGNPVLKDGIDYEQDKIIKTSSTPFLECIHDTTDLIKTLWGFGIHESVYNFTINNGYNDGRLVLIDFNEVTFTIEDAIKDIENKVWLQRYSYTHLPKDKKPMYADLMEKEITVETLRKSWGIKINKNH